MNEGQKTKIKEMWNKTVEAKQAFDEGKLAMHLERYREFVLNLRNSIADICDYDSFRIFRAKWKESGEIAMLPKELAAFNRYLSLANAYNAELIPELMNDGKIMEFVPVMFTQEELDIIKNSGDVYRHPFAWDRIRASLVGNQARMAVYTHAVACMSPDNFRLMIDDGSIRMETLESLPYAVCLRDITGNGENDRALQRAYQKNLVAIYEHYGKDLPDVTREEVLVCGDSFEKCPQRLNHLLEWAREYAGQSDAVVHRMDGKADINRELLIELERHTFHNKTTDKDELVIRVLATIPGDPKFCRIDIGHIPKEITARIEKETPRAMLAAELEEIGPESVPGHSGTAAAPYARLTLIIGDAPYETGHTAQNPGAEVDDLFNEELR